MSLLTQSLEQILFPAILTAKINSSSPSAPIISYIVGRPTLSVADSLGYLDDADENANATHLPILPRHSHISRHHFTISFNTTTSQCHITTHSKNGIFVNGEKLAVGVSVELRSSDKLRIAQVWACQYISPEETLKQIDSQLKEYLSAPEGYTLPLAEWHKLKQKSAEDVKKVEKNMITVASERIRRSVVFYGDAVYDDAHFDLRDYESHIFHDTELLAQIGKLEEYQKTYGEYVKLNDNLEPIIEKRSQFANTMAVGGKRESRQKLTKEQKAELDKERKKLQAQYNKPDLSYIEMIHTAMKEKDDKTMSLQEVYQWIMDKYPYYKYSDAGWKSSVRHTMSQSKGFKKVPQPEGVRRAVYELVEEEAEKQANERAKRRNKASKRKRETGSTTASKKRKTTTAAEEKGDGTTTTITTTTTGPAPSATVAMKAPAPPPSLEQQQQLLAQAQGNTSPGVRTFTIISPQAYMAHQHANGAQLPPSSYIPGGVYTMPQHSTNSPTFPQMAPGAAQPPNLIFPGTFRPVLRPVVSSPQTQHAQQGGAQRGNNNAQQ